MWRIYITGSKLTIKKYRSINYENTVKSKRLDKRNKETNLRAIFLLILKVLPISFSLISRLWLLLLLSKVRLIREIIEKIYIRDRGEEKRVMAGEASATSF
jgi:hypothetical protein